MGALTLRYPKRVMTEEQAAQRYGPELSALAREIAQQSFAGAPAP
jgi:hypothetical protein